jgi:hypothetical protein
VEVFGLNLDRDAEYADYYRIYSRFPYVSAWILSEIMPPFDAM